MAELRAASVNLGGSQGYCMWMGRRWGREIREIQPVEEYIIVSIDPNELSGGETFNCEYVFEGDVLTVSWTQENQVNVTLKLKKLE